jgi:DNA polymerase I-like protein with 3'-5' exonuclease and polymerase domains
MNPTTLEQRIIHQLGLATSQAWLDEIRTEARESGKDFYTLVAAKNSDTPYDEVTKVQRDTVKVLIFHLTYGSGSGSKKLQTYQQNPPTAEDAKALVAQYKANVGLTEEGALRWRRKTRRYT